MAKAKYGVIKQGKPQFPVRGLLVVPHKGGDLIVSYPAFGPNTYIRNMKSMAKTYSHPETGEQMHFRPASTSESISAVAYGFETMAKPSIFDLRWLQAGYIVRTQDGVFTNTTTTDGNALKKLLNGVQKVNGIYIINDEIAFAPRESFERGVQDCDTFAQGGLARALEHTTEKTAKNLREIASPKYYKRGVNVWGFDDVKKLILKVASLDSGDIYGRLDVGGGRLDVVGDGWGDNDGGCAYGVRP